VVLVHLAFVLFVVGGGLLLFRWKPLAWVHLPSVIWAGWVELAGWICPLTPLELRLREGSGGAGYSSGFVEHYLLPVLYPTDLTRGIQIGLGLSVLLLNAGLYGWVFVFRKRFVARRSGPSGRA
jgi:hypothetical protein